MPNLHNLARMTTGTTGTGTITLGGAATIGGVTYMTFAAAGVVNNELVYYGIADTGGTEVGYGTYTSSGTTLSRNVIASTNSNTALNLSGSAQVFITSVAAAGGDILPGTANPLRGFDTATNLQLLATTGSGATVLTVALQGNNQTVPSPANPIMIPFKDPDGDGYPVWRTVIAPTSISTIVGATLGTANGTPFRLWVVAFDNAGTVVLALWQSVAGGSAPTAIKPLSESNPNTTTAISSGATSAGVFYTPSGTTISTPAAFRILGYVEYSTGVSVAGTYPAPTLTQLFGPGVSMPGSVVQVSQALTTTTFSTTSSTFQTTNLSANITPTAAPNLVRFNYSGSLYIIGAGVVGYAQVFRGSSALGPIAQGYVAGGTIVVTAAGQYYDAPGSTSQQTYAVKVKNSDNITAVSFPNTSAATITLEEIMI